jgi:hypothetical protein
LTPVRNSPVTRADHSQGKPLEQRIFRGQGSAMTIPHKPKVDDWYEDEEGRAFRIVAVDDSDGAVEVQYFDGDVEEFDRESWYLTSLRRIEAPEDGTGPFDDPEQDAPGDLYDAIRPEDWEGLDDEMDFED